MCATKSHTHLKMYDFQIATTQIEFADLTKNSKAYKNGAYIFTKIKMHALLKKYQVKYSICVVCYQYITFSNNCKEKPRS